MTPATVRFYEAVLNGGLSHNGDRQLAQPVANCLIREDASGARLSKPDKNSPRRIDAPVAGDGIRPASVAETSGPAIVRVRCSTHTKIRHLMAACRRDLLLPASDRSWQSGLPQPGSHRACALAVRRSHTSLCSKLLWMARRFASPAGWSCEVRGNCCRRSVAIIVEHFLRPLELWCGRRSCQRWRLLQRRSSLAESAAWPPSAGRQARPDDVRVRPTPR